MSTQRHGVENCPTEWVFCSTKQYADPFYDVEVDAILADGAGRTWRVPAYWAGDHEWRVRFTPPSTGTYSLRMICSDPANLDLHGQTSTLLVAPYLGANPLFRHGPLCVSDDRRHLQHQDGTPFFWLGDLWWLGLTKRLAWPEEFQFLVADRKAQGFSVIQLVAGLHCDMPAYDSRGYNEAGHPWEPDYMRINPSFFDMMDLRIQWLVRSGLVPCIFGAWGFHLLWLGAPRMKQHWRYLVARYGAYPVVWSLAGSITMPYYLSEQREVDREQLTVGWVEMARYLRQIDPYGRLRVAHPFPYQAEPSPFESEDLLHCYFIHTGQGGEQGFARRVGTVKGVLQREPMRPVIQGEGCFEGFPLDNWEEVQRMNFWAFYLLGIRGLTYSANGIWQFNNEGDPFGPSANGIALGNIPWREAYRLAGSRQVALGKRLLERYPWWNLVYHPEWVEPHANKVDLFLPYAAGIPRQLRIVYMPKPVWPSQHGSSLSLRALESDVRYRAFFFDPKTGTEQELGYVAGETSWPVPLPPTLQDWVLVLERA